MAKGRKLIRMKSTGKNQKGKPTGYFLTTSKSESDADKLKLKKYDPRAWNEKAGRNGMHVLFEEDKIK
jgi:ribosomal protein L33